MVEASILFKLLNPSILDMYKVFMLVDMLSIDILSSSGWVRVINYSPNLSMELLQFLTHCRNWRMH
jgi:hypothetical protein